MPDSLIYCCPTTQALRLDRVDSEAGSLLFRKQLIYEGDFVQPTPDGKGQKFAVNKQLMQHWCKTHQQFRQNGIRVPLPVKHSDNPEDTRGELLELEICEDEKGRASLYGVLQFRDADAAKLATTSDVSIFVPPDFTDGKGNKYDRPIQHVAFTDYPVIPALSKFTPIVASHTSLLTKQGALKMSIATLAEKMQLPTADKDEAMLEADIFMAVSTLKSELDNAKGKLAKYEEQFGPLDGEDTAAGGDGSASVAASLALANHPLMRSTLLEARKGKLEGLVRKGKLLPAAAKDLEAQYLSDAALTLSLSQSAASGKGDEQFDGLIAALDKNQALKLSGEQTGGQSRVVANDPNKNPLLAEAKRRKDVAAAKK